MPFHRGRLDLAGTPPPSFGVLGTVRVYKLSKDRN
jgi:hypothetical protein